MKVVAIKSERSLRRHKAAGAKFECSGVFRDATKKIWWDDPDPYTTLRDPIYKRDLVLRAVYPEDAA